MSNERPGPRNLGQPQRSSVDWFFTPRPGATLDAANVRLASSERPAKAPRPGPFMFVGFLLAKLVAFLKTDLRNPFRREIQATGD